MNVHVSLSSVSTFSFLLLVFLVATVVSGGDIATQVSVEGGCGKIPFGPSDAAAT